MIVMAVLWVGLLRNRRYEHELFIQYWIKFFLNSSIAEWRLSVKRWTNSKKKQYKQVISKTKPAIGRTHTQK